MFGLSLFCFLSLTLYDILKTHQLDDNIVFMNSLLFLILHLSDRNIPIALANIEMKFICMCQKIPLTMSVANDFRLFREQKNVSFPNREVIN